MDNPESLFNWLGKPQAFQSVGEYFLSDDPPDRSLLEMLGVERDSLKPLTMEMLESMEEGAFLKNLKAGFRAFCEFQDLFPLVINRGDIPKLKGAQIINRDYCYYESLVYLRSSIIAALDKNPLAAMTLLRPFLELSVLQVYWYVRSEADGYWLYHEWLAGHYEKPGFNRQLERIMNKIPARDAIDNARLKRLKKTFQTLFTSLCRYNHGSKADDSMASLGGPQTGFSLDSFYIYLATVDLLLSQLVYLYVLTYPMILFPVESIKKWGVRGGPVGMYADAQNYKIVRAYLGKSNVETLKESLSRFEYVKNLLDYFNAQPDLTEAEQEQSWVDFVENIQAADNPVEWPARIAMNKSYYRSLRWCIHYDRPPDIDEEIDHDQVESMFETAKSW